VDEGRIPSPLVLPPDDPVPPPAPPARGPARALSRPAIDRCRRRPWSPLQLRRRQRLDRCVMAAACGPGGISRAPRAPWMQTGVRLGGVRHCRCQRAGTSCPHCVVASLLTRCVAQGASEVVAADAAVSDPRGAPGLTAPLPSPAGGPGGGGEGAGCRDRQQRPLDPRPARGARWAHEASRACRRSQPRAAGRRLPLRLRRLGVRPAVGLIAVGAPRSCACRASCLPGTRRRCSSRGARLRTGAGSSGRGGRALRPAARDAGIARFRRQQPPARHVAARWAGALRFGYTADVPAQGPLATSAPMRKSRERQTRCQWCARRRARLSASPAHGFALRTHARRAPSRRCARAPSRRAAESVRAGSLTLRSQLFPPEPRLAALQSAAVRTPSRRPLPGGG
jgi:hypothetical protein